MIKKADGPTYDYCNLLHKPRQTVQHMHIIVQYTKVSLMANELLRLRNVLQQNNKLPSK